MGGGVSRHGAQSQLRSCGALPAIPNQMHTFQLCLCTHIPHEYRGTWQETRAFAPGQASAEHLPCVTLCLRHYIPCPPGSAEALQAGSTSPDPPGHPSLRFTLSQSSYFASGPQKVLEAVQLCSPEITPEL